MTKRSALPSGDDARSVGIAELAHTHYLLRLYVAGFGSRSVRAAANIRKFCEEHLSGHYDLEVVDVALHPELAVGEQIVAAPTLIKISPLPIRRFIGDMSRTDRLLLGMDVRPLPAMPSSARGI